MSDETPELPRLRCMHLYCKAMAVYGEYFEMDPDYQAGMSEFWCLQTQKGLGPDAGDVNLDICSNPERSCYQAF